MQAEFRPGRRSWLIVIALGHAVMLMAWRPSPRHAIDAAASSDGELMLLSLPPPLPPRPTLNARQAVAGRPLVTRDVAHTDAPSSASEEEPQTVAPPVHAIVPDDPFATPAKPAETLREKARKSVAGIDRQLRKESLNKFATIVNEETALGLSISGGPQPKLGGTESYMGANGMIHKRYMLRGKVVCEEVDHVGLGGRDPFRSGSHARFVKCPK